MQLCPRGIAVALYIFSFAEVIFIETQFVPNNIKKLTTLIVLQEEPVPSPPGGFWGLSPSKQSSKPSQIEI